MTCVLVSGRFSDEILFGLFFVLFFCISAWCMVYDVETAMIWIGRFIGCIGLVFGHKALIWLLLLFLLLPLLRESMKLTA